MLISLHLLDLGVGVAPQSTTKTVSGYMLVAIMISLSIRMIFGCISISSSISSSSSSSSSSGSRSSSSRRSCRSIGIIIMVKPITVTFHKSSNELIVIQVL